MSTMESEYYAVCEGMKDILFLKNITNEAFSIDSDKQPVLFCGNKAAISVRQVEGNRRNIRHIDLKYLFIKKRNIWKITHWQ